MGKEERKKKMKEEDEEKLTLEIYGKDVTKANRGRRELWVVHETRGVGVTQVDLDEEKRDRRSRVSDAVIGRRLDVVRCRVLAAAVHVRARGQVVRNAHALVAFIRAFATTQIKPRDECDIRCRYD